MQDINNQFDELQMKFSASMDDVDHQITNTSESKDELVNILDKVKMDVSALDNNLNGQ